MQVSQFTLKFSGPYLDKLRISLRFLLCGVLLATNHDVTVVLDKANIIGCKEG